MFTLINLLISLAVNALALFIGADGGLATILSLLLGLYSLAILLPSLAVGVRRIHDIGMSGWWIILSIIPIIGWIVLIIFFFIDSKPGTNQYGPNPKESGAVMA